MAKWNIYTPEGVRDILFDECYIKRNMEGKVRELFRSWGYFEIETPTLEFYDAFSPETGLISQETMFKFFDQQGRILVLRPDATIPAARLAATKLGDGPAPVKLSYIGNTFRYNELGGGKQKEFTVAGAEIIGAGGPQADAEIISMAINAVKCLGIENFQIDIGQMDFFRGLMEQSRLADMYIEQMRVLIDRKDSIGIEEMVKSHNLQPRLQEIILDLPRLFGSLDLLDRVVQVTDNEKSLKAINNLRDVFEILDDYGLSKYISIDLGMVQNLNFYSGIIFKGFTYDIGFPILRGGRYDDLVGNFGKGQPATGFSLGLNMVLMALERQELQAQRPAIDTIIGYEKAERKTAFKLWNEMRKQGLVVEMDVAGRDAAELESYAKAKSINGFLFIAGNGDINVYNIETGEAVKTSMEELINK